MNNLDKCIKEDIKRTLNMGMKYYSRIELTIVSNFFNSEKAIKGEFYDLDEKETLKIIEFNKRWLFEKAKMLSADEYISLDFGKYKLNLIIRESELGYEKLDGTLDILECDLVNELPKIISNCSILTTIIAKFYCVYPGCIYYQILLSYIKKDDYAKAYELSYTSINDDIYEIDFDCDNFLNIFDSDFRNAKITLKKKNKKEVI